MAHVDTNGEHGLFLHEQLIHLHTKDTQTKLQIYRFDEDITENNYMFLCYGI